MGYKCPKCNHELSTVVSGFFCPNCRAGYSIDYVTGYWVGRAAIGTQPATEAAGEPSAVQHLKPEIPSYIECMSGVDASYCGDVPNNEFSRGAKDMYEYIARHFGH